MDKKRLIPIGGLLVVLCFFLPWVRACGVNVTGLQLASDNEIGDSTYWLVLICGIAIAGSFYFARNISKFIAILGSIAGLALLIWKIIVPLSKGESQEVGISLQIGGIGTILGFLLSLIGGTTKEKESTQSQDLPNQ
jgi:hypothetical protein